MDNNMPDLISPKPEESSAVRKVEVVDNKKAQKAVEAIKAVLIGLQEDILKVEEEMTSTPQVTIQMPEKMKAEITNLPPQKEIQKVEMDMSPFVKAIEKVKIEPKVNVEVQAPEVNVPPVDFSPILKMNAGQLAQIQKIFEAMAKLPIQTNKEGEENGDPNVFLPVRLTDGKKFYKPGQEQIVAMPHAGVTSRTSKYIKSIANAITASGQNIVIPAVSGKRIKVTGYSVVTTSNSPVTVNFRNSGASVEIWKVGPLIAPSGSSFGANLMASPNGFIFATDPGVALDMNLSILAPVTYSISYHVDDDF